MKNINMVFFGSHVYQVEPRSYVIFNLLLFSIIMLLIVLGPGLCIVRFIHIKRIKIYPWKKQETLSNVILMCILSSFFLVYSTKPLGMIHSSIILSYEVKYCNGVNI